MLLMWEMLCKYWSVHHGCLQPEHPLALLAFTKLCSFTTIIIYDQRLTSCTIIWQVQTHIFLASVSPRSSAAINTKYGQARMQEVAAITTSRFEYNRFNADCTKTKGNMQNMAGEKGTWGMCGHIWGMNPVTTVCYECRFVNELHRN